MNDIEKTQSRTKKPTSTSTPTPPQPQKPTNHNTPFPFEPNGENVVAQCVLNKKDADNRLDALLPQLHGIVALLDSHRPELAQRVQPLARLLSFFRMGDPLRADLNMVHVMSTLCLKISTLARALRDEVGAFFASQPAVLTQEGQMHIWTQIILCITPCAMLAPLHCSQLSGGQTPPTLNE